MDVIMKSKEELKVRFCNLSNGDCFTFTDERLKNILFIVGSIDDGRTIITDLKNGQSFILIDFCFCIKDIVAYCDYEVKKFHCTVEAREE